MTTAAHKFTIPDHRTATLNELTKRGLHWAVAARMKKADRSLVAIYSAGVPRATTRRRVSVRLTLAGRMREVDPDAVWKSLLDALVAAGLLVDDSARWVELGTVTQERGSRKGTTIILEDLD